MTTTADVLCAGIVVADHVCSPISHVPAPGELVMTDSMLLTIGGCAANVAVDLGKMGVRAMVQGRVGDDIFGKIVAALLQEQGVDVAGLKITPGAATSQTLIVNVVSQDRRFVHTFGANGLFSAADIPLEQLSRYRVLYLGGYLVMPKIVAAELAPVFAAAQRAGVKTVLDVVTPGPGDYLPHLAPLLPFVDVFTPNRDEAALICGEREPLRQAEYFRKLGAKTVVITLGSEGAVLVTDNLRLRAGTFSMPYIDGSGGGDAFDAGYICGLLQNLEPRDCLRLASALGASCVRAIGTTPGVFTRAECAAFLQQQTLHIEQV